MSEPFLGQITMVGFTFAPRGWALCQGQLLSIAQNDALFALLGTTFGGDGVTTFGLPDFQGRAPIHSGQGPGLSNYVQGQKSGTESVTLTLNQLPAHNHVALGSSAAANQASPGGFTWASENSGTLNIYTNSAPNSPMAANAITVAGGSQPHDNSQPTLVVNICIALEGIFPSRN